MTRIAIISDIHANLPALQAVLADIKSFGVDQVLNLGDIFLCHGAPESDGAYLLEEVNSSEACLREDSDIMALIGDCPAPVIACGHTHIARAVRLSTGQMVVNPGSVG